MNREGLLILQDGPWTKAYIEEFDTMARPYWRFRGQWKGIEGEGEIIQRLIGLVDA
jgi:hypothetical protein